MRTADKEHSGAWGPRAGPLDRAERPQSGFASSAAAVDDGVPAAVPIVRTRRARLARAGSCSLEVVDTPKGTSGAFVLGPGCGGRVVHCGSCSSAVSVHGCGLEWSSFRLRQSLNFGEDATAPSSCAAMHGHPTPPVRSGHTRAAFEDDQVVRVGCSRTVRCERPAVAERHLYNVVEKSHAGGSTLFSRILF